MGITHPIVMCPATLRALLKIRGMRQSKLAQETGISRQIVSYWVTHNAPEVNVHSKNLGKVASCLGVTTDMLARPLPLLTDEPERKRIETALLWDRLYPDLESFVSGLLRSELSSLARLVQVYGIIQSEKVIGKVVLERFPQFKFKIAPAQRKQAEILWTFLKNPD